MDRILKRREKQKKKGFYSLHDMIKFVIRNVLKYKDSNQLLKQPLSYYTNYIKNHQHQMSIDVLVEVYRKYVRINYFYGIHQLLALIQKIKTKETIYSWILNDKNVYLRALQSHWSIELNVKQFVKLLNDVSDILEPEDLGKILVLVSLKGMHEKMKVLL